jgi:NAD(P)H dehydrogenase (quinone)
MKKFFIVYGHYDDKSFNAAIKNTFIEGALEAGYKVDLLDLYKDNLILFLQVKNLDQRF